MWQMWVQREPTVDHFLREHSSQLVKKRGHALRKFVVLEKSLRLTPVWHADLKLWALRQLFSTWESQVTVGLSSLTLSCLCMAWLWVCLVFDSEKWTVLKNIITTAYRKSNGDFRQKGARALRVTLGRIVSQLFGSLGDSDKRDQLACRLTGCCWVCFLPASVDALLCRYHSPAYFSSMHIHDIPRGAESMPWPTLPVTKHVNLVQYRKQMHLLVQVIA